MNKLRTHNFTGKSDFWDWCNMHYTPETILKNAVIFLNDAKVSLTKEEDLIPYYTHLIATAYCSSGDQHINLSKESYFDTQEKNHLAYIIYDAIKLFRKKKTCSEIKHDLIVNGDYSEQVIIKSIVSRIENYPEIIKFHLNKNYNSALNFITEYLIPHYFYNIHDERRTKDRTEFIEYAALNGYKIDINGDGEYHPIIWDMVTKINDYNRMIENEGI